MTSTLHVFRTLAVAAAALLYATSAAPQSAARPRATTMGIPRHDSSTEAIAAPSVMERIAALDQRIQMLATDMRMLSGEMKVDVMASLLSTMLERQSLMEGETKPCARGMMRRMMERRERRHLARARARGNVRPGELTTRGSEARMVAAESAPRHGRAFAHWAGASSVELQSRGRKLSTGLRNHCRLLARCVHRVHVVACQYVRGNASDV